MSIVITGNPGVGKHTIAKELAKELQLQIIDINKIAQEFGLFEKNEETNDVDVSKLKKLIIKKISVSNLIVGHLAPYVLDKNQVKIVIVLRRDPYDLISVYKKRGYSDEKIRTPGLLIANQTLSQLSYTPNIIIILLCIS